MINHLPENVLEEIKRHDVMALKVLPLDHQAVTTAIAFLMNNGMEDMAKHLRQMALNNFIRVGDLHGFVAAAAELPEGEFLLLSNHYPEYNTPSEMMASIVSELGASIAFTRSSQENEMRAQKALQWLKNQRPATTAASFISSAVLKHNKK